MIIKFFNESKYAGWVLGILTLLVLSIPLMHARDKHYTAIELRKCGVCIVGMKKSGSKGENRYIYTIGNKEIEGNNSGSWFSEVGDFFPVVYLKGNVKKSYMIFDTELDKSIYNYGDTLSLEQCRELRTKVNFWKM